MQVRSNDLNDQADVLGLQQGRKLMAVWTVSYCVDGDETGTVTVKTMGEGVHSRDILAAIRSSRFFNDAPLGKPGSTIHYGVWREINGRMEYRFDGTYRSRNGKEAKG